MASTATPYGLRPVGLLGGRHYAGSVQHIKIASGYAANIFNGDAVKLVAAGTVEKDTGTNAMTPVGVFLGCEYTDPSSKQKIQANYWPTGTVASDAKAYVCTDPYVVMQVQASGTITQADLGGNFALTQGSGSTVYGTSGVTLTDAAGATTNTLPVKLVGFVDGPNSAVGDAKTDCLVIWNAGHQWTNTTGVGA